MTEKLIPANPGHFGIYRNGETGKVYRKEIILWSAWTDKDAPGLCVIEPLFEGENVSPGYGKDWIGVILPDGTVELNDGREFDSWKSFKASDKL